MIDEAILIKLIKTSTQMLWLLNNLVIKFEALYVFVNDYTFFLI